MSNVVGIQQLNAPNVYNGLNFQQAFTTPGFGFQQQGSLFNHNGQFSTSNQSPFPNNHNFQLSSFVIPFFNQNHNPNQQQGPGSFPSFGIPDFGQGNTSPTSQVAVPEQQHVISTTIKPPDTSGYQATESPELQSSIGPSIQTTVDPTYNFDIRLEKDKETNEANETSTPKIQTSSRRTIEGLPTSDEDDEEGGVLDDKIGPKIVTSLVG